MNTSQKFRNTLKYDNKNRKRNTSDKFTRNIQNLIEMKLSRDIITGSVTLFIFKKTPFYC